MAGECAVTLVWGQFGPWSLRYLGAASRLRRILAGGCSGISRVSTVRVRFRVKSRVKDGCREGQRRTLPKLLWQDLFYCVFQVTLVSSLLAYLMSSLL